MHTICLFVLDAERFQIAVMFMQDLYTHTETTVLDPIHCRRAACMRPRVFASLFLSLNEKNVMLIADKAAVDVAKL